MIPILNPIDPFLKPISCLENLPHFALLSHLCMTHMFIQARINQWGCSCTISSFLPKNIKFLQKKTRLSCQSFHSLWLSLSLICNQYILHNKPALMKLRNVKRGFHFPTNCIKREANEGPNVWCSYRAVWLFDRLTFVSCLLFRRIKRKMTRKFVSSW